MAENSKLTGIELNGVLYSLGKSIYEELDLSLVRFAELLGRDFYCPTLSEAPTSSTLKYTDTDGEEQTFQLGQPCRWAEGNDYRIAVCKNITSTNASWYVLPVKMSELKNDAHYLSEDIPSNGVYIESVDGLYYTAEEWNGTKIANGIAIITDMCMLTIGLQGSGGLMQMYSNSSVRPNLPSWSSSDKTKDFSGKKNTMLLLDAYSDNSTFVVGNCVNYTFPNGEKGYLLSAGELQEVLNNLSEVNGLLQVAGGEPLSGSIVTSTLSNRSATDSFYWFYNIDSSSWIDYAGSDGYFGSRVVTIVSRSLDGKFNKVDRLLDNKQDAVLKFTDMQASSWVSDSTYSDYPYRCDIPCAGVTGDMYAEVVFNIGQSTSGDYAPVCETKEDIVSIWGSDNTTITIPTIIITK